jgi:hypothetical protein
MNTDGPKETNAARQANGSARDSGYGVFLMLGLLVGLGVGIAVGQPSAGTVIGLGVGGLLALGFRFFRS